MLGGARVAFGPGSFMQANFGAMDAALAAIAAHVPAGSAVADLHCGVGTIGACRGAYNTLMAGWLESRDCSNSQGIS